MYVPSHFAAGQGAIAELLSNPGAANLVTSTERGLLATLLPFVYDPDAGDRGALLGHVARNNEQWLLPAAGESLVIIQRPDAYISPTWYPSKAEHGRVVPTWNYTTAHVYGELVIHDDPAWVEDLVRRLTALHEASSERPWTVDDAPARFIAGQLRAIVGVELRITRIEAKRKLSQNRSAADVGGVISGLRARGDLESAGDVEQAQQDQARRP
ncbi:Protease synthase and sporulation protein PAI 2 [Arthrobacter sp. SO5]|uniref:FMN-binding negative transcriptional regulator n=1 Tax=Arthrobacter sp. SO5 TaxID=1897055 RepID=UPI001E520140|nr:FMN-binding negative transcriptional regulator [Arthrobacter sp. SO5]MCB5275014.1 Protease synthase and sporulation protein PAI 2 [Arthrobacter sp. SO5]